MLYLLSRTPEQNWTSITQLTMYIIYAYHTMLGVCVHNAADDQILPCHTI